MLRIGEFNDSFLPIVDGVGRVVHAYAETLCRMGHQVTVVAPMYDTGYRGGYPFELVDFQSFALPGAAKQYRQGEAPTDPHYRARMRMIELDIVHAHSPFTCGSEAIRLASQRNIPLVGTFHSKYYDDFYKATKSEALARLGVKFVLNFYERCDEVWACSAATADVLHGYGFEGEVHVMPNGVHMNKATESDIREVERRWQLGRDPLFLFVGQMNWKKNILAVLEGCAKLHKEGKRFQLILAGQGPDLREIQHKIYELNLAQCTHLAGQINDNQLLSALYARACLFTFPSLYDNAPMVVREAAVAGTPALMIEGSSAAEIITDRQNGYLCRNTPDEIAAVLDEVIQHPDAAHEIGQRASETIPIQWERILEDAVVRYERLIAQNREGKLRHKTVRVI